MNLFVIDETIEKNKCILFFNFLIISCILKRAFKFSVGFYKCWTFYKE